MKQYLFVIAGIITVVLLMAAGGQISPPYNGGSGGAVASVFGRTGAVVAAVADYASFYSTLGGALSTSNAVAGTGAGTATGGGISALTGTDSNHQLAILTGTTPIASGTLATVTFTATRGHISSCSISPANSFAAVLSGTSNVYFTSNTASGYVLTTGTTALLSGSQTYAWNITCP